MSRVVNGIPNPVTDDAATTSSEGPLSPSVSAQQKAQHFDPELIEIIERWPTLPDSTKQALIAIVRGDKF